MAEQPLGALRVIDASESIAGQFASRLFADYGADVLVVEPPGGSRVRTAEPIDQSSGASLLFAHLNGGKSSMVLDLTTSDGRDEFIEACAHVDAVIVSSTELAVDVSARCPLPIVAVIEDFGSTGDYAAWRGSELVHQALSGSMFYTGAADREPLYGVGHRASYAAGLQLYIGLTAGIHQRTTSGSGPRRIDVTVHEAAAAMEQNFSTQYGYNGTFPRRGEQTRPRGRAKCLDGWVVFFVRANQWPEFCRAFKAPELIDDPRFAEWGDMVRNWSQAAHELHLRASDMTIAELAAAADRDRLVLAPIMTLDALWDEEHLRGRGYWQSVSIGDGPAMPALGPVFRMSATTCVRDRPPPALDERSPVWEDVPARAATDATDASASTSRPLEGVRVLDFSSAWAGPMATRILASLGAEIVKIEGPARLDAWRGEPFNPPAPAPYPDLDPGDRPYNRHAWFNSQNHDKRSVVLDIKQPVGLETIRQLVAVSDIVLANWSPGALARVGLGYDELVKVNADVIVVKMPAISNTGPLANQRGLGPTMEGMSGITSLIGYPDGPPLGSGSAYLDPTGGLHGAAAALTALLHRDRRGGGQVVEVAQREAAMHWIGELILDTVVNGTDHRANGNAALAAAPHGAYPTSGDDEWIAIGVDDDEQWQAVADCLDSEALRDQRFATFVGRREHREAIDAALADATRERDKLELAHRLQAVGVPAAPVQNGRDLFNDSHLRARHWFTSLKHDDVDVREYPGLPLVVDGERLQPTRLSPRFGQDTRDVLWDVLGMNEHDITELANVRATATEPRSGR